MTSKDYVDVIFVKKKTGGAISQESLLETRNIFLTIIIYHAQDVYNFLIFSIPEPYNYLNKSHILSQILGFFLLQVFTKSPS